jgi:hypothetical protein
MRDTIFGGASARKRLVRRRSQPQCLSEAKRANGSLSTMRQLVCLNSSKQAVNPIRKTLNETRGRKENSCII